MDAMPKREKKRFLLQGFPLLWNILIEKPFPILYVLCRLKPLRGLRRP